MIQTKIGELIYVPSEVMLYKRSSAEINRWVKLKEPTNLLVTSINDSTFEVFYDNDYWLVERSATYKL